MREIRRRTRVVGAYPDGNSALILVAARLRHVVGTKWGHKRYLDMSRLKELDDFAQETTGGLTIDFARWKLRSASRPASASSAIPNPQPNSNSKPSSDPPTPNIMCET